MHGSKTFFLRSDIRRDFPAIVVFSPMSKKMIFWANVKFGDGKNRRSFSAFQKGGGTR
jgi:hypothetical protein